MRDFNQLWNSTASYSVLASSCYYLNLLLFTCYTVSFLEMHKKIHGCPLSNLDSKSELRWGGTAELSQQLRTGPTLQSVLGTTSPGGLLLSQRHFTWLTIHLGKVIWITGTWNAYTQGLFTERKGAVPESECGPALYFLFFYYHRIVLGKTKINMVQESLKSIKNMISLWLPKLKVSLSFSYYILGSHLTSSSQFSKPFNHVLNVTQEFRLQ